MDYLASLPTQAIREVRESYVAEESLYQLEKHLKYRGMHFTLWLTYDVLEQIYQEDSLTVLKPNKFNTGDLEYTYSDFFIDEFEQIHFVGDRKLHTRMQRLIGD